jgi:hypothetical protein
VAVPGHLQSAAHNSTGCILVRGVKLLNTLAQNRKESILYCLNTEYCTNSGGGTQGETPAYDVGACVGACMQVHVE